MHNTMERKYLYQNVFDINFIMENIVHDYIILI